MQSLGEKYMTDEQTVMMIPPCLSALYRGEVPSVSDS